MTVPYISPHLHISWPAPMCMKPLPTASQHAAAQLQTQIVHLEDAHGLLDSAVAAAMRNSKPVYISVCCNLAGEVHGYILKLFLCLQHRITAAEFCKVQRWHSCLRASIVRL